MESSSSWRRRAAHRRAETAHRRGGKAAIPHQCRRMSLRPSRRLRIATLCSAATRKGRQMLGVACSPTGWSRSPRACACASRTSRCSSRAAAGTMVTASPCTFRRWSCLTKRRGSMAMARRISKAHCDGASSPTRCTRRPSSPTSGWSWHVVATATAVVLVALKAQLPQVRRLARRWGGRAAQLTPRASEAVGTGACGCSKAALIAVLPTLRRGAALQACRLTVPLREAAGQRVRRPRTCASSSARTAQPPATHLRWT
mmetsp:Transcript_23561/g.82015  ORF Transcript_23561/g.82015 Transcript_23561/m.82015 type:complete len:258 (+) Transcript_23561:445-1218(+)